MALSTQIDEAVWFDAEEEDSVNEVYDEDPEVNAEVHGEQEIVEDAEGSVEDKLPDTGQVVDWLAIIA